MDDTRPSELKASPAPHSMPHYPWYVHLLGGYALTGAFCWLLVAGCFWHRRQRLTAAALIGVNAILLATLFWAALRLKVPWWQLQSATLGLNLAWSLSAWLVQYRLFGPAPRRYYLAEWRRWRVPLATGALLGAGLAVSFAVMPAVGERITALYKQGAIVHRSVLWQFFKTMPIGLAAGLLVGAWWAGCRRFTASRVVSFLAGITVVLAAEVAVVVLLSLMVHGSYLKNLSMLSGDAWALVPGPQHGWRRILSATAGIDFISLIPLGMCFGAPQRLRNFLKRCAVIVPLFVLLGLPLSFLSSGSWTLIQGRLIRATTSPRQHSRDAAFDWLRVLLARYPDHAQWPYLAARLADYDYRRGNVRAARRLHRQIIDRFADFNQWKTQVNLSRSILASPSFGDSPRGPRITIPMISTQNYLTRNWMALLATIRYWQGNTEPLSQLLIGLRDISESDDHIELPQLTGLADLDDAVSALRYGMTLLPADANKARSLIQAGIPVILPVYNTFYLIYGFDDSRRVVEAYCFAQLSGETRSTAVKEAREVLMLEPEGHGRTKDKLARIRREAGCMWPLDQWRAGRLTDAAPLMVAIHPIGGRKAVAKALGTDVKSLSRNHHGLLAALIALTYFDNADPIDCIRWSQIAARSTDSPLVWQAAYLGAALWRDRSRRIGTAFQLEDGFPILGDVDRFLGTEDVKQFMKTDQDRFTRDLAAGRLNWPIRRRLLSLMDRYDAEQRRQMIKLVQANLSTNPADENQWHLLADLYALDDNPSAQAHALAQAWSANPQDTATALAWANACALLNEPARVERILQHIDPAKVRHQAEYPFCLATVAEWKNHPREALRDYARATDLCHYRSVYYRRYGRLLMARGDKTAGKKALAWAASIDGGAPADRPGAGDAGKKPS
jgi:hypothetical protein